MMSSVKFEAAAERHRRRCAGKGHPPDGGESCSSDKRYGSRQEEIERSDASHQEGQSTTACTL
jgi:hypothetical protein